MVKHTGGFIQETHLNIYIQEQAFAAPEEVLMAFKVTNVIDGDTFEVLSPWKWRDQSGIRVRPTGYNTPEGGQVGYQESKNKLRRLILEKEVELRNFVDIDYDRLVCDVYFNGKNLADYFPEYKE